MSERGKINVIDSSWTKKQAREKQKFTMIMENCAIKMREKISCCEAVLA